MMIRSLIFFWVYRKPGMKWSGMETMESNIERKVNFKILIFFKENPNNMGHFISLDFHE